MTESIRVGWEPEAHLDSGQDQMARRPESIRVGWESEAPFLLLVMNVVARITRRKKGEPTEALGYVWVELSKHYRIGDAVDSRDRKFTTIVSRKVIDFYRRENHSRRTAARLACDSSLVASSRSPADDLANRELARAIEAAFADLDPRRREAAQSRLKLGGVPVPRELAESSEISKKSVYQRANQGLAELRTALSKSIEVMQALEECKSH
jgi:RNA polymerase sigma factor (sigma-70 family)